MGRVASASELIEATKLFSEPHFLLTPAGEVLAANPAARRAFALEPRAPELTLHDLVAEPPGRVEYFLRGAARSSALMPGRLNFRLPDDAEQQMSCLGGLLRPAAGGQSAILLVKVRREKSIPGFMRLNERIGRLTRALHERRVAQQALQAHSARLVELTGHLEVQKQEAQAASRAKSNFLAAMSHELRTPLNAILGYTELLQLGVEGAVSDGQRVQLDRIRETTTHLVSIINEILDHARYEAKEVETNLEGVEIVDLAETAADMIEPAASAKRLQLVRVLPEGPVIVRTDSVKVRQILLNLLSNAVKFTHSGTIRLTVEKEDDSVSISVADTGIGIEPDDLERVFQPFWQARENGDGTGLGLAVTNSLAAKLGGSIEVRSERGEGTTFTVYLRDSAP